MNEAKVPVHGDMGHGISQLAGIPLAGVLSGVTSRKYLPLCNYSLFISLYHFNFIGGPQRDYVTIVL